MANPITFTSRTNRFGLPYLFPGQAQKEFYINEAYALLDALLQPVVEGLTKSPPAQPVDGTCWLVDSDPTDAWAGHASELACFQAGTWLFAPATEGMRVFDRSTGVYVQFRDGWVRPATVYPPSGGSTVDAEARTAITSLVQALAASGALEQG
jgi:hypothetical protein